MTHYVYIESDRDGEGNRLYTVGFYHPSGRWDAESDHTDREAAAARVAYLNGERAR